MDFHKKQDQHLLLALCVAPAFIVFTLIKLIPAVMGLYYSLTNWNGINPGHRFIGLENFRELFSSDPDFWISMQFTLRYVIYIVILMNAAALLLALGIESLKRGKLVSGRSSICRT